MSVGRLVPARLWVGRKHRQPAPPASQKPDHSLVRVPRQEKAAFRELISQLELDPKCRGLPLSSFLILPFQRITRLKLLVQVWPPAPSAAPNRKTVLLLRNCSLQAPGSLPAFWEVCLLHKSQLNPYWVPSSGDSVLPGTCILGQGETNRHTARKWPWL